MKQHDCWNGLSWLWSYGSWLYNYLCNQCLSPLMLWVQISIRARCTTLWYKVCQLLVPGRWVSPGPPLSSNNETDCHDITEILLRSVVKHYQINKQTKLIAERKKKVQTQKTSLTITCTFILKWQDKIPWHCLCFFHPIFLQCLHNCTIQIIVYCFSVAQASEMTIVDVLQKTNYVVAVVSLDGENLNVWRVTGFIVTCSCHYIAEKLLTWL